MSLPVYNITLKDFQQGMYRISLVDKPAIEENMIHFSEQEESTYKFADEEKKEVVGPIMIPDKEILRFSKQKGYYYVKFSRETIEEIIYNYSKKGLFNEFNIQHQFATDSVVMLEFWMKESENDKSKDYGYNLPDGTVFVKAKIESDELFESIKNAEINGFSIEILADIELDKNDKMEQFEMAKELGKFEFMVENLSKLVDQQKQEIAQLNEKLAMVTNWEERIKVMEERYVKSETDEATGKTTYTTETNTVVTEEFSETKVEDVVEEAVEEEFSEEQTEEAVEEEFVATQEGNNEEEVVEDKTIVFNAITPSKIKMINDFFNR